MKICLLYGRTNKLSRILPNGRAMAVSPLLRLLVLAAFLPVLFSRKYSRAPQEKIRVDPIGHWFIDEYDRVRIFHGVNSVRKDYPWYFPYLLNDTRLDDLEEFGMNIIRLGTMWSGVEPAPGVVNETYLAILEEIIQRSAERGIYVLLDMHQDVMSSFYDSYDGIPRWVVEQYPEPTNPYPWPLEAITSWAMGYLTQACSEGFQHLYNNTANSLDDWAGFWGVVAQRLGYLPSVLGYDYINEPWVGDFFSNEALLVPGVAGRRNLLPSYDVINEVIRRYDQSTIQFYEPVTYGILFPQEILGSGFDRVPGGDGYADVSAYSYHQYCWPMEILSGNPNATDEDRQRAVDQCANTLIPRFFDVQAEDVERTGGTSMLTEFGLCKTSGTHINIECETYLNLADRALQSWVDWDYSDGTWYDPQGNRRMEKIIAYVRPYAQAIAGIPLNMTFNSTTRHFHLAFSPDASIEVPTEIFVPSLRYPDGYIVYRDPVDFDFRVDGNFVHVFYTGDMENFPTRVDIDITPAQKRKPAKVQFYNTNVEHEGAV